MLASLLSAIREVFATGGWVMPPLVLLTLLLWFALGYRMTVVKRGTKRSVRVLLRRYRRGWDRPTKGMIDGAVVRGLQLTEQQPPNLRRHLDAEFAEFQRDARRFSRVVKTVVSVAPLLGLLGTVVGMIETFDSLGDMTLYSQSGGIAGGISQALFTTQMGLVIAIPGLIVHGILARRQKTIEMELAQLKDMLCAPRDGSSEA